MHKYGIVNFEDFKSQQKKPYADSKLANVYFARELAERMKGTGVAVHTVHPGMVNTELSRHSIPAALNFIAAPLKYLLLPSAQEGCQGVLNLAVADLENETGKYYGKTGKEQWPDISSDSELWRRMWDVSAEMTNLPP